jgi:hypothetical protein
MSTAGVVRFLEAVAADYPCGIPSSSKGTKVVRPSAGKRAVIFVDVSGSLDEGFWKSAAGEGLQKIVTGGFKLAMSEVEFRAGEVDFAVVSSLAPQLVVKFGGPDFDLVNGKKILADSLYKVLESVESKRRLWNEIKRVWA